MLDSYQGMASAMPPQLSFRFTPRKGATTFARIEDLGALSWQMKQDKDAPPLTPLKGERSNSQSGGSHPISEVDALRSRTRYHPCRKRTDGSASCWRSGD